MAIGLLWTSVPESVNVQTLLVGVTVLLLVALLKRKRDEAGFSFPPGPKPWPILGNIPQVRGAGKPLYKVRIV
jgi:hypothetical protein